MDVPKVSVIIPSFNRFKFLLKAIESVKNQTYDNIEIIVVNDRSTEKAYYEYDFEKENVIIIHVKINSKNIYGFPYPQRNYGLERASGKYIAFLDDDDIWFPNKLELQIKAMEETGCKMSCTDGLIGKNMYDPNKPYKRYNTEHYYNTLQLKYKKNNSNLLENGFPKIWNLEFLKIHNCCICSSVILDKDIVNKVGKFNAVRGREDYDYWLRALKYTSCVYITDTCFYYDAGHGYGKPK